MTLFDADLAPYAEPPEDEARPFDDAATTTEADELARLADEDARAALAHEEHEDHLASIVPPRGAGELPHAHVHKHVAVVLDAGTGRPPRLIAGYLRVDDAGESFLIGPYTFAAADVIATRVLA